MNNNVVSENDATGEIKQKYDEIKKVFGSPIVPIFFTYISPYPDYFLYIIDQIIKNVEDERFQHLVTETGQSIQNIVHSTLLPSEEYREWIKRYAHSPSFYHFEKDNEHIFRMNVALTFIFIALRETVKGWAVAAKKLPGENIQETPSPSSSAFQQGTPLYEKLVTGTDIILKTSGLTQSSRVIEKNLLHDFLKLCQMDFLEHKKTDQYVVMRVGLEELILSTLPLFPNLIFSPINVVLRLTVKYPRFSELLYLLSEDFPTLVMQRTIFSAYMLKRE